MKKIIYTFSLSLITLLAVNVKAQSVSYTYVKNDPFDIKNFSASIDPLFIDVNGHNGYAFGWGLRAEYMMGKRLLANFDSRIGFGTNLYRKSNVNTKNYFGMDGGLGLVLSNKARTKNVPIILSQSTSGNTRTTMSIRGGVPAKVRLIVALRGGFSQYNNTLDFSKLKTDSLLSFKDAKGEVSYRKAKDNSDFIFSDTTRGKANAVSINQYGGISMVSLYAGFQFRTIRQLLIDVDGYGYRGNIRYSDFFIDVLFAPVVKFRDFKTGDGRNYQVSYSESTKLGWRLGWFWRKPKDQGFSAKFEFGSRPGFKAPKNQSVPINTKNLYAVFSFGLYIPLNIKPVYTGED